MIGELSLSGGSQVSRTVTKEVKESDRGRQRKGGEGEGGGRRTGVAVVRRIQERRENVPINDKNVVCLGECHRCVRVCVHACADSYSCTTTACICIFLIVNNEADDS